MIARAFIDRGTRFGILFPMNKSSVTVIDDGKLRGVVAPARFVSKETLEDLIDMVEISTPEEIRETERRIREADTENSWIPSEKIEKRIKARLKMRK